MFEKELEYFKANQAEWVKKHNGKVLVIQGGVLLGVYVTALQAYLETQKVHPVGTFMIQPCEPGPSAYSVTIASTQITA
jgi:hypothetical protein